ncbi:MAG: hypothetical protein KHY16_04945, partial [Collinsella sp.]|nr:hypothetical protein [Collinsella sp.]
GRLPGLDIMLHPQINAHKESLPFLMSKKWEAVQCSRRGFFVSWLSEYVGKSDKRSPISWLSSMAPLPAENRCEDLNCVRSAVKIDRSRILFK